jgi:hypothetical protein
VKSSGKKQSSGAAFWIKKAPPGIFFAAGAGLASVAMVLPQSEELKKLYQSA